eukprot:s313_g13.t1
MPKPEAKDGSAEPAEPKVGRSRRKKEKAAGETATAKLVKPPKRHQFSVGGRLGDTESSTMEGVRKACRSLDSLLESFESFVNEASTLARAIQVVSEKISLLTSASTTGAAGKAMAAHPGTQERLLAQLVSRVENFRSDGLVLHARFERQHHALLEQSLNSLRLWKHRREAGAPLATLSSDPEDAGDLPDPIDPLEAAERIMQVLAKMISGVSQWKEQLLLCRYLPSTKLPAEPEAVPVKPNLQEERELLLKLCAKSFHDKRY